MIEIYPTGDCNLSNELTFMSFLVLISPLLL